MRDLAKYTGQIKNALVIGPGNEKAWGIESYDNASADVYTALHDHCVPVLSGMPLYSAMVKKKGKPTAWHFNASDGNVTKMATYIYAAVELLQGLRNFRNVVDSCSSRKRVQVFFVVLAVKSYA